MPSIHHINLGVPPELMDAESAFLTDVLGYRKAELDEAAAQVGAHWFDADDGTQIHLSPDPDHVAGARAHTALVVGDEIDLIEQRLQAAGAKHDSGEFGGRRLLFCKDPAGNRFELRVD